MYRIEVVRTLVLAEISDDFEEPEHVNENITEIARLCGLSVERSEVLSMLRDLVESGYAKAYLLSMKGPAVEVEGPLPQDGTPDLYFLITDEGLKALAAWRRGWHLSDEGILLPDRLPPDD